jgi:hypothetical protein
MAIQDASGTWFQLVINEGADLGWFGAVGDGVTDDTVAVQTAFDYAWNANKTVVVPPNTFLVQRVNFKGVNVWGNGSSFSIFKGTAGKDIWYVPDISISEPGSILGPVGGFSVRGIGFQLDDTAALTLGPGGDFNRPVYPVIGTWSASLSVSQGQFYRNNVGKIYQACNSGVTGASQPVHTVPTIRASDGVVTWEWMADAQRYIGNACIAVPMASGALTNSVLFILRAIWEDVLFTTTDGNSAHGSCGLYSARAFYANQFTAVQYIQLAYGYANVPPVANNNGTTDFSADDNMFLQVQFSQCSSPFIAFNADHNTAIDLQIYATNEGNKGYELLYFLSQVRNDTSNWMILNAQLESPSVTSFEFVRVQGTEQFIRGGEICSSNHPYVTWSADFGSVNNTLLLAANFYFVGMGNNFTEMRVRDWGPILPTIVDTGTYNNFSPTRANTSPDQRLDRFIRINPGTGSPNGVITGNIGDIYINDLGGSGTTMYVKESGTNTNTGWVGK